MLVLRAVVKGFSFAVWAGVIVGVLRVLPGVRVDVGADGGTSGVGLNRNRNHCNSPCD